MILLESTQNIQRVTSIVCVGHPKRAVIINEPSGKRQQLSASWIHIKSHL